MIRALCALSGRHGPEIRCFAGNCNLCLRTDRYPCAMKCSSWPCAALKVDLIEGRQAVAPARYLDTEEG